MNLEASEIIELYLKDTTFIFHKYIMKMIYNFWRLFFVIRCTLVLICTQIM